MYLGDKFGCVNGHAVGIIMKEMVRRAIEAIRAERFMFEVQQKQGLDGAMDDLVTSADKKAQPIYVRTIRECFPFIPIIAEEDFRPEDVPNDCATYFTVDPLDGTKAFGRRQSHGIGTMIGLVTEGEIAAAYVGDVMTREIYGFRPGSEKVHRISEYEHSERLTIDTSRPLSDQYVSLREHPLAYSPLIRGLIAPRRSGGLFKDIDVGGGSIGITMARLWKGEVGCMILGPAYDTPWDTTPIVGISQKLGFRFFMPIRNRREIVFSERSDLPITPRVVHRRHEVIIVHESRLHELSEWVRLV